MQQDVTTPVKLGIIGCGIAARDLHWPALQKLHDKIDIVAVCNHTEPKARSFAMMVGGVPYVLDYRELLRNPAVEAVDIVLPIDLNRQVTEEALAAGKHVIVEKPLAGSLSEAKSMLAFPERYQPLVMMVAENFRYRPTLLRAKEILAARRIGAPYAVFWNIFFHITLDSKYAQTRWRLHHSYPGGFITDGGVHNIAALRLLFGDIVEGTAFTKCVNPQIGKMDGFSFQFATESGVDGVLNIFVSASGCNENHFVVCGDRGTLIIEPARLIVKRTNHPDSEEHFDDDGGYLGQFEDFYQAIRHGTEVQSPFAAAYRDLEVIVNAQMTAKKTEK